MLCAQRAPARMGHRRAGCVMRSWACQGHCSLRQLPCIKWLSFIKSVSISSSNVDPVRARLDWTWTFAPTTCPVRRSGSPRRDREKGRALSSRDRMRGEVSRACRAAAPARRAHFERSIGVVSIVSSLRLLLLAPSISKQTPVQRACSAAAPAMPVH